MNVVYDIDSCVNYESDECKSKAQDNKWPSSSGVIGCEGENQEHYSTTNVWRHSIQIGLDCRVTKTGHDLREEERDGLQRHAQADFNCEKGVGSWLPEDLE